jgi:hypothetical protein
VIAWAIAIGAAYVAIQARRVIRAQRDSLSNHERTIAAQYRVLAERQRVVEALKTANAEREKALLDYTSHARSIAVAVDRSPMRLH